MDKVLFLFSKDNFTQSYVNSLSRQQCENCAKVDGYEDDGTFIKIDAQKYATIQDAVEKEGFFIEDWYVKSFGF